ncbi:MAG: GC-type dockerin domain-anchored protein [Planctomycetota bacterium]
MRIETKIGLSAAALVAASASAQLNPSFETAGADPVGGDTIADWTEFNNFTDDDGDLSVRQSMDASAGMFACEMFAGTYASSPGQVDAGLFSSTIAVNEGDLVEVSFDSKANSDGAIGIAEIQFLDALDNVVGVSTNFVFDQNSPIAEASYSEVVFDGIASTGATQARILFVHVQLAGSTVPDSSWLVDNVSLQVAIPPVDPVQSFELLGPNATNGWEIFTTGQFINQVEGITLAPREGDSHFKMFGAFNPFITSQGAFQDVPAAPGDSVTVSCYAFNDITDAISGGNEGFLNLEFIDAGGNVIEVNSLPTLNASSTQNTYDPMNPTAGWEFFTQTIVAPAGTAEARYVVGYNQDDAFSGGAIYYDTLSLTINGGSNELNNPGIELPSGASTFQGWDENPPFPSGNIFPDTTGGFARSFGTSAKIFGQFTSDEMMNPTANETSLFQTIDSVPGDIFLATAYGRQQATDPLQSFDDFGFLRLEFLGADGTTVLQTNEVFAVDFFTSFNVWTESTVGGMTAPEGLAPAGTRFARISVGLFQDVTEPRAGSVFFDDVTLERLVEGPPLPGGCSPADVTTTGATLPGQPGFGEPDDTVDLDDLGYYLGFFLSNDASVADLTTSGATLEGQPGFGVPDGVVDLDDLGFYLNLWLAGCPQ